MKFAAYEVSGLLRWMIWMDCGVMGVVGWVRRINVRIRRRLGYGVMGVAVTQGGGGYLEGYRGSRWG